MMYRLILCGILWISAHLTLSSQCTIMGTILSMPAGDAFLVDAMTRDTLDKSIIRDHTFQLLVHKDIDDHVARPAMLMCLAKNKKSSQTLPVALENDVIQIDIDSLGAVAYSGTKSQDEFNGFLIRTRELSSMILQQGDQVPDSVSNALGIELENFYAGKRSTPLSLFASLLIRDMISRRLVDPSSMPGLSSLCQHADTLDAYTKAICEAISMYSMEWTHVPFISFKGTLSDNSYIWLDSIIGSRPVILDFWASWCGPCIKEMPALKEMHSKGDIEIIGISIDASANAWKKSLDKLQLPWINVWDEGGVIAKKYQVSAVPTKFVIDKNGMIVARNPDDFEAILASLRE